MTGFSLWFFTGVQHILDISGYDHMLFVTLVTLSAAPVEWKKLLLLVTAFTLGHSVTLALSVWSRVSLPAHVIEFLIALSILAAALFHLFTKTGSHVRPVALYFVTTGFGLLHGLGFSFLLRSMLGSESAIALPLLYFNLGIEAGQLIIVAAVSLISIFLATFVRIPFRYFKFTVVCLIALIALKVASERLLLFFA